MLHASHAKQWCQLANNEHPDIALGLWSDAAFHIDGNGRDRVFGGRVRQSVDCSFS